MRSFPAVKTLRLRVEVNTTPLTLGLASRDSSVERSDVHTAVFMELTGSRCSETIARVSLSVYVTERMLSVMLEYVCGRARRVVRIKGDQIAPGLVMNHHLATVGEARRATI